MEDHLAKAGRLAAENLRVKGSSFDASTDRKTSLLRDRPAEGVRSSAPYRIWVSDAAHHCVQLRVDLLFTMSDNLHRAIEIDAVQIQGHGRVFGEQASGLPSRSSRLQPASALRAPARQPSLASRAKAGGARRDRTDDLLLAKQALSQLSYGPRFSGLPSRSSRLPARLRPTGSGAAASSRFAREGWWAWEDLNFRPHAYQARALTN